MAFSPDGNRVAAAGSEQAIRIWDSKTSEEIQVLYGHADVIWGLAWGNDGRTLFSFDVSGFLRAWDLQDRSCRWGSTHRHNRATSRQPTTTTLW